MRRSGEAEAYVLSAHSLWPRAAGGRRGGSLICAVAVSGRIAGVGAADHASLAVRRWQTQVSESSNLERGADSADTDHVGVAGDAGW